MAQARDMSFAEDRFWKKIAVAPISGCWLWTGAQNGAGYGMLHVDGKGLLAHRFAYEALVEGIPDGMVLDHLCRTTTCVNPCHLEVVTQRENNRRGMGPISRSSQQRALTHCLVGHPFDETNTYVTPGGHRQCRECHRVRKRGYRAHARGAGREP